MTEYEKHEFIEQMEEIGDKWEPEDVERVYGNCSLEEALSDRKRNIGMLFNIISETLL